jgi:hypothetical protein
MLDVAYEIATRPRLGKGDNRRVKQWFNGTALFNNSMETRVRRRLARVLREEVMTGSKFKFSFCQPWTLPRRHGYACDPKSAKTNTTDNPIYFLLF